MKNKSLIEIFYNSSFASYIYKHYKKVIVVLLFFIFSAVFYLVLPFLKGSDLGNMKNDISKNKDDMGNMEFPKLNSKSYYINTVSNKKIFKKSNKKKIKSIEKISYSFVKNFVLKGIMTGKIKRAVIENKNNGESYVVGEGDTFRNIEVKSISKNQVKLYYKGKFFNLQL